MQLIKVSQYKDLCRLFDRLFHAQQLQRPCSTFSWSGLLVSPNRARMTACWRCLFFSSATVVWFRDIDLMLTHNWNNCFVNNAKLAFHELLSGLSHCPLVQSSALWLQALVSALWPVALALSSGLVNNTVIFCQLIWTGQLHSSVCPHNLTTQSSDLFVSSFPNASELCWTDIRLFNRDNVQCGVTIHRTGPHRATPDRTGPHRTAPGPYRAGNDWLLHFYDELKGVRRANYPQLSTEMNPSRRSWWIDDGRIQCFLHIQLKPWVHCYALILLVTVVEVK